MIKIPFLDTCNGTYTTSTGQNVSVSMEALLKVISGIPERPRIFTMDFTCLRNDVLSGNTIILGKDVADALEEAIEKEKEDE